MGRLSTFAKNRILYLRFQKSFRIKQIAQSLQLEDSVKVSRKSISTFLKKYIETKSINDKPRSGRNKKLTPEEINLIGEITRLNRDITAPKIKEYLNLNVSTYTILRASKLFEWNKLNPNSNEAKKAAALERQLNGEAKKRRTSINKTKKNINKQNEQIHLTENLFKLDSDEIKLDENLTQNIDEEECATILLSDPNLNLISEMEILAAKNASSSPMVFATKILYKVLFIKNFPLSFKT
jgi:transposase